MTIRTLFAVCSIWAVSYVLTIGRPSFAPSRTEYWVMGLAYGYPLLIVAPLYWLAARRFGTDCLRAALLGVALTPVPLVIGYVGSWLYSGTWTSSRSFYWIPVPWFVLFSLAFCCVVSLRRTRNHVVSG